MLRAGKAKPEVWNSSQPKKKGKRDYSVGLVLGALSEVVHLPEDVSSFSKITSVREPLFIFSSFFKVVLSK